MRSKTESTIRTAEIGRPVLQNPHEFQVDFGLSALKICFFPDLREDRGAIVWVQYRMDLTLLSAILVGAGCLALGYYIGARYPARFFISARLPKDTAVVGNGKKNDKPKESLEIEKLADILEDFKMVLVVRNDLKMGKGKIAAQCSHATLGLYKKLLRRAPKALNRWEMCAQPKVVVKIESEEDMLVLQERAKSLNIPTHITIDAGRTQIAPNSRTVMAILGPIEVVDEVTGGLKLL